MTMNHKVNDEYVFITERQHQVAILLCKGMTNKEIAKKLKIAIGTVKMHLWLIYPKYSVTSRCEFIAKHSHMFID